MGRLVCVDLINFVFVRGGNPALGFAFIEILDLAHAWFRIKPVGYRFPRGVYDAVRNGGIDGFGNSGFDLVIALPASLGPQDVTSCGAEDKLNHSGFKLPVSWSTLSTSAD